MTFLTVSGINKKRDDEFILKDINFSQRRLKKIALAGETGAGKSTLLKMIAGLDQPDSGEIIFAGSRVEGAMEKLVPGHAGIAYLSQYFDLPHSLRVEQVLRYANTLTDEAAHELYEVCEITHLLKRRTDQLSGGERQRIALARLLTEAPELLLLDEPFSNLDAVHKSTLKSVIHAIGAQLKITCILISHDPLDTVSWADEILVMKNGTIQQHGTPEKIYRKPVNEYVAGLFGKYNILTDAQAQALNTFLQLKKKSKRMLIRPENVKVVSRKSHGIKGIVKQTTFFGSYYEVEVLVEDDIILVKAESGNFSTRDLIYIAPVVDQIWYV